LLTSGRGIVDNHGGKLWAEARSAFGTSFLFTLPSTHTALESLLLEPIDANDWTTSAEYLRELAKAA